MNPIHNIQEAFLNNNINQCIYIDTRTNLIGHYPEQTKVHLNDNTVSLLDIKKIYSNSVYKIEFNTLQEDGSIYSYSNYNIDGGLLKFLYILELNIDLEHKFDFISKFIIGENNNTHSITKYLEIFSREVEYRTANGNTNIIFFDVILKKNFFNFLSLLNIKQGNSTPHYTEKHIADLSKIKGRIEGEIFKFGKRMCVKSGIASKKISLQTDMQKNLFNIENSKIDLINILLFKNTNLTIHINKAFLFYQNQIKSSTTNNTQIYNYTNTYNIINSVFSESDININSNITNNNLEKNNTNLNIIKRKNTIQNISEVKDSQEFLNLDDETNFLGHNPGNTYIKLNKAIKISDINEQIQTNENYDIGFNIYLPNDSFYKVEYTIRGNLLKFLYILELEIEIEHKFDLISKYITYDDNKYNLNKFIDLFSTNVHRRHCKSYSKCFFEIILKKKSFAFLAHLYNQTKTIPKDKIPTNELIIVNSKNFLSPYEKTIYEVISNEITTGWGRIIKGKQIHADSLGIEYAKYSLIINLFFIEPKRVQFFYTYVKYYPSIKKQEKEIKTDDSIFKFVDTILNDLQTKIPFSNPTNNNYENKLNIELNNNNNNTNVSYESFTDILNNIINEPFSIHIDDADKNSFPLEVYDNIQTEPESTQSMDIVVPSENITPSISSEKAYTCIINSIEETVKSKAIFLNAMFKNRGKCEIFASNLIKNMLFISKKFNRTVSENFLTKFNLHFGIGQTENIYPLPEDTQSISDNTLSYSFRKFFIPAIYEYKKKQFEYLISKQLDTFTYIQGENVRVPSILLAQDNDRAIILPAMITISGCWFSNENNTNQGFNEHIAAIANDTDNICLHFFQERVCPNIQLEENGTIYLDADQLRIFSELMIHFHKQNEFPLRVLPFAGRLQLDNVNHVEGVKEDIIPLSICEAYDKQNVDEITEEETVGKKRNLPKKENSPEQPIKKKTKENHLYLSKRRQTIQGKGFKLEEESHVSKSINEKEKKQGTFLSLTGLSNHFSGSRVISDNFWDMFITEIKNTHEKIKVVKAKQKANALKALDLPIFSWLNSPVSNTQKRCPPLIRTLKKYQIDTFNKIESLLANNINPLCSLEMGLGKTLIYTSQIANIIAKKPVGITVILVPAATRTKTIQELMWGISEAQSTAFLHYSKFGKKFQTFWKDEAIRVAFTIPKTKQILKNDFSLFNTFKPLLMVAEKFDIAALESRQRAYNNFKTSVCTYFQEAVQEHLDSISKTLNNAESNQFSLLRAEIREIKSVQLQDGEYIFNPPPSFKEFLVEVSMIANLSLFPREKMDENLDEHLNEEQCLRLIQFSLSNIANIYKMLNQKEAFNAQLDNNNSIIVLSYKTFANLLKDEGLKLKLFNATHRLLVTDESQYYHTEIKQTKKDKHQNINKLMHEYSTALKRQDVLHHTKCPILQVTGTPYENNPRELFSLINISNNRLCGQNKTTIQAFPVDTVAAISDAQNKTVTALMDIWQTNDFDLLKKNFVLSFAQWRVISSQILDKIVISKRIKDPNIAIDWPNQIPTKIKRLITLEIPEWNKPLKDEVENILKSTYSKITDSEKGLQGALIRASGEILGKHLDINFKGNLKNLNQKKLTSDIAKALEAYSAGDKKALNNHQYVLDLITNETLVNVITKAEKLIIVRQHVIEDSVLELVLKYLGKIPLRFGKTDDERKKAIDTLTNTNNTVLILPLKAGGVGLNLGFVNDMILLGKHWNPAIVKQAIARILRVGKDGDRNIYICVHNNIHERFISCVYRQKSKHAKLLISAVIDLKKLLEIYSESLVQIATKNYLLRGQDVEGKLRAYLKTMLQSLSENEVLAAIEQVTPIAEKNLISEGNNTNQETMDIENLEMKNKAAEQEIFEAIVITPPHPQAQLSPEYYYRIPLKLGIELETLCKMAAYISNVRPEDPLYHTVRDFFKFMNTHSESDKKGIFEKVREIGWSEMENQQDVIKNVKAYHVNFYLYNHPHYIFSHSKTEGTNIEAINLFERKLPNGKIYYEILISKEKVNEIFKP